MSRLFGMLALFLGVLAFSAGCGSSNPPPFDTTEDTPVTDSGHDDGGVDNTVVDTVEDDGNATDETPVDTRETIQDVGPVPCERNSDCKDVPLGEGECQKKICDTVQKVCALDWDSACCMEKVYLTQDFENGMGEWTVYDPKTTDTVGWAVSGYRKAFGAKSAYFGNATCHTYYSGALNAECKPVDPAGADSAGVRGSITSPYFSLPAISASQTTFAVSAYMWIDSEPMIAGYPDEVQPDQVRVSVLTKTAEVETSEVVFASFSVNKTTEGQFVYVTANISKWVGKDVAIRISFDSLDGKNNLFEGVYVDDIKVFSSCAGQCDKGTDCAADAEECSDNKCQGFSNNTNKGLCSYPLVPTCVEPECTPATAAQKCITDEQCVTVGCVEGRCTYTPLPDDQCCRQNQLLTTGFEDGTLSGFEAWSYQNNQVVKWQPSSFKAADGGWSMYYGDILSRTYDTLGTFNFGQATSPSIEIPSGEYAFLSFDLMLATEWDEIDPAQYYNPGGFDFFQVEVVERYGQETESATAVWTSHNIQGTTNGVFLPVGVDLSAWAGKIVWIRFRFDTGNEEFNNFEGVYVDNVAVSTDSCIRRKCQSEKDCGVDGICRVGSCRQDNTCDVSIAGATGCCAVTQDCDDGDDCTADGCVRNVCLHEAVEKPGCCFEDVRAEYTFDIFGDLDGFAVVNNSQPGSGGADVKWHLTETNSHSPARSMYFGNSTTGSFDNGGIARGIATSPSFRVPSTGDYALSFFIYVDVQTESNKDTFIVDVMDGLTPTTIFSKSAVPSLAYRGWFEVADISMNQWKGKDVKLRFSFDSVDSAQNTGAGILVDDIRVERKCD